MAILLHVGLHKCASSYIQSLFSSNTEKLLSLGIRYPGPVDLHGGSYHESLAVKLGSGSGNHSLPLFSAFCEYPESYSGIKLNSLDHASYRSIVLEGLSQYLVESSRLGLHSFLSAEELSQPAFGAKSPFSMIGFLKEHDPEVHIISIVRNPMPLLSSIIQQKVKGGNTLAICYRDYPCLYKERLQNWFRAAAELGAKIHPFNLDAANDIGNKDILDRVFSVIPGCTVSPESFDKKRVKANHSLSALQVHILSKVNKLVRQRGLDAFSALQIKNYSLRLIKPHFAGAKYVAPSSFVRRFSSEINSDCAWINELLVGIGCQSEQVAMQAHCAQGSPRKSEKTQRSMTADIASLIVEAWGRSHVTG